MSLNYNFTKTMSLLFDCFKYNMFKALIIVGIVLLFIFYYNKNNKYIKYVILGINVILVGLILYYYFDNIVKFDFKGIINNMYFYFFNTIIFLIVITIKLFKDKKIYNLIFYILSIIGISFSLFMTHYLKNIDILVIGNIYPIMKIGNIVYFIYYIFLIFIFTYNKIKK